MPPARLPPFAQQPLRFVASPTPLTRLPTAFPSWSFRSPVRRTSATVAPPTTKHAAPPPSSSSSSLPSSSSSPSPLSSSSQSPRIDNKVSSVSTRAALVSRHFASVPNTPQHQQNTMSYTIRKVGQPNTLEHRIYHEKDGVPVSPFHDIPLYANEQQNILNMIVEIPRWTNAKQEVCSHTNTHPPHPVNSILIPVYNRFPRRSSSTPSSRMSRRASCVTSVTAFPTRVTSGTTVPSPRYVDN